jgi:hypothetical protein
VELNCPFPILPLGRVLRQDSELRRVVAQSTLVEFLSAETAQLSFTEMSKRREHYTKLCSILQQLARTPATVSLLSTLRFDNLCMQVSQWCLLVAGNTPPHLVLATRFAASTTHGQLSAAKEAQPLSHALTTSNQLDKFDSPAHGPEIALLTHAVSLATMIPRRPRHSRGRQADTPAQRRRRRGLLQLQSIFVSDAT